MSDSDPNRLERIEALVESNARAIEALASVQASYQGDRTRLYQLMSELAQTGAGFQAKTCQLLEDLDKRQGQLARRKGEITEILKLLVQRDRS